MTAYIMWNPISGCSSLKISWSEAIWDTWPLLSHMLHMVQDQRFEQQSHETDPRTSPGTPQHALQGIVSLPQSGALHTNPPPLPYTCTLYCRGCAQALHFPAALPRCTALAAASLSALLRRAANNSTSCSVAPSAAAAVRYACGYPPAQCEP